MAEDKDVEDTPDQNEDKDKDSKTESNDTDSEFIKLKVVGSDANEVHFKIKFTTQMIKLKNSYSERMGIPVGSLRFLFDGRRISDSDTPRTLDMKNGDQLEVYQEQVGGF